MSLKVVFILSFLAGATVTAAVLLHQIGVPR